MKQTKTYILKSIETAPGCWIDKTEAKSIRAARKIFAARNTGRFLMIVEYGNTDIYTTPECKNVRL